MIDTDRIAGDIYAAAKAFCNSETPPCHGCITVMSDLVNFLVVVRGWDLPGVQHDDRCEKQN